MTDLALLFFFVGFSGPLRRVAEADAPPSHVLLEWRFKGKPPPFSSPVVRSLHPGEMKLISSKEILKNKLFTVTDEVAVDPDGFEIHRNIVRHPGSAVMMPVDDKNRVLLVQQYRLPAKQKMWELPAGRLDPGESPLKAARRELQEETGYKARRWVKLGSFYASPGYVEEKMNLFLALELSEGPQQLMDDERIECRWFGRKELGELIRTGKIIDGKTIVGYFLWLDWLKNSPRD